MTETIAQKAPLFEVRVETDVSATPEQAYAVVSDLPRCGEWSEECTGGEWLSGEPGEVGAVFRGHNWRSPTVVAWAPVVRGEWSTHAEVVAAEIGTAFRWAMCDSAGAVQESVWSFEIAAADDGCRLTHHFRMGAATEGIRGITAEMDPGERAKFFSEWGTKLAGDMDATLARVKGVIEKDATGKN